MIPLKGIYLADHVYPSPGIRRMGDIDLLVPRPQLAQALAALTAQGYQAPYAIDIDQECGWLHHLPPLRHANGLVVDLHWTLVPPPAPFRIDVDQIWESSLPITFSGVPCRGMSPVDLLLHLSIHAAYLDLFAAGIRSFCDIAWVLKIFGDQIDWPILASRAEQWNAGRCLWLALQVAGALFQAPLPDRVPASLDKEHADPLMVEWAIAQIVNPSEVRGKLARVWAPHPFPQRVGLFVRQLFPPQDEMRPFYPRLARGLLWPFAYLQHLGIVIRRNWKLALRLLRHEHAAQQAAQQRERVNRLLGWLGMEKDGDGSSRPG